MRASVPALTALAVSLALAAVAGAVGPSLPDTAGTVSAGGISYVTALKGATSTVEKRIDGRTVARIELRGGYGLPLVTLNGELGGLGPRGRVLVLGDNVHPEGVLRAASRLAVIRTAGLTLARTISLSGDYNVDALSPDGRWLYLIHHVQNPDLRYEVMAYDLRAGRLLPQPIVDKREHEWLMSGYPIARAISPDGRWVYTMYQRGTDEPFIHALDTVTRSALCVDLPWGIGDQQSIGTARLALSSGTLRVLDGDGNARFAVDRRSFAVKAL
jgi:hypothetical protein